MLRVAGRRISSPWIPNQPTASIISMNPINAVGDSSSSDDHLRSIPISSNSFSHQFHFPSRGREHHQDLNNKILIPLIIASTLLGGILLFLSCFWIYRRKTLKNSNTKNQSLAIEASKGISLGPILDKFNSLKTAGKTVTVIEYQLLVAATNNFRGDTVLGEGGRGRVYKACFNDQFHAAVKRLQGGGLEAEREFENEVAWLSRIQHQNVISLLGYCIHGETRFLVYELMHNRSLESQLHGPSQGSALTWHLRMKVALDIASSSGTSDGKKGCGENDAISKPIYCLVGYASTY